MEFQQSATVQTFEIETTPERSALMRRVRQRGTEPELVVGRLLRRNGAHFKSNTRGLPGTPDFANRRHRWAIFVHGCYWHAHAGCRLWKIPKRNSDFWSDKFIANRVRDDRKCAELHALGFQVLVVWQCQLDNEPALGEILMAFIERAIDPRVPKPAVASNGHVPCVDAPFESYKVIDRDESVGRHVLRSDGSVSLSSRDASGSKERIAADPGALFDKLFLCGVPLHRASNLDITVHVADLFSGCGGLSLGAREACMALGSTFVPVFAADLDADAAAVYRGNFQPRHFHASDIRDVVDGKLEARTTKRERTLVDAIGSIDLLLAGPPCQGHSNLNNHTRRDDERNALYERVARFARVLQPKHVVIENVPGVVHSNDPVVQRTLEQLGKMGYHVDAAVVDLSEIGVAQRRRRHVIVASLTRSIDIGRTVERFRIDSPRSVAWAIRDLSGIESEESIDRPSRHSAENLARMRYLIRHGKYDLPNERRPACHRSDDHSYKSMYGRMRWDEPAQTITSGFGSPGQGRYVHPDHPRTLTPHEAARLQFFPDSFDFSAVERRTALATMIGNAVPMKLSYILTLELFR